MAALLTGLELEFLLPPGETRATLAAGLAEAVGGFVEPFAFSCPVPLPPSLVAALREGGTLDALLAGVATGDGGAAAALTALHAHLHGLADHHGARDCVLGPELEHALVVTDAYRVRAPPGAPLFELVHDVTLAGGAQVCELVTAPFAADGLPFVLAVVQLLASIEGLSLPAGAALHVHVDARGLTTARSFLALVVDYARQEAAWRARFGAGAALRAAGPLPPALLPTLQALCEAEPPDGGDLAAVRAALSPIVVDKSCGLNLWNIIHADDDKPTVELKLARASFDPAEIAALHGLFVAMVEAAQAARG